MKHFITAYVVNRGVSDSESCLETIIPAKLSHMEELLFLPGYCAVCCFWNIWSFQGIEIIYVFIHVFLIYVLLLHIYYVTKKGSFSLKDAKLKLVDTGVAFITKPEMTASLSISETENRVDSVIECWQHKRCIRNRGLNLWQTFPRSDLTLKGRLIVF